jgi:hypothetical protein
MFRLRPLLAPGLALALTLTFGVGSASADLFNLDNSHFTGAGLPFGPPYIGTVEVLGTSTQITIEFKANAGLATENGLLVGFHEVAFNYVPSGTPSISMITHTDNSSGNSFNQFSGPSPYGMDGYGNFTYAFGENGGGPTNQATDITFTITGTDLSLSQFEQKSVNPPGDTEAYFAVHLATTASSNNTWFAGATGSDASSVPEPSTMLIAAIGAIGLVGYGLRRRITG